MLTVSSTAALESVGAGVRTALIADLDVREQLGNHIFLDSGLLRTFDQLERDDVGIPAKSWFEDYFFDTNGVTPGSYWPIGRWTSPSGATEATRGHGRPPCSPRSTSCSPTATRPRTACR